MIVLLVGSDARADTYQQGLADTIWVVRMDFVDESISLMSVLWVSSPALDAYAGRLDGYFGDALDPAGKIIEETGAHTTLGISAEHYVA